MGSSEQDRVIVSHLLFADDTLVFCGANASQIRHIGALLVCFETVLRLKVNRICVVRSLLDRICLESEFVNRLFIKMWRSIFSVSSRSSLPPDIVNSEHVFFENDNSFNFDKWNIPKLSPKDVYTTSTS